MTTQSYANLVPCLGMDNANVIGAYDPSLLFDSRGEPMYESYCQGGIPQESGTTGVLSPQIARTLSLKETDSIQEKLAFMDKILKPDRICMIREPFQPSMPTIQEDQAAESEMPSSVGGMASAQQASNEPRSRSSNLEIRPIMTKLTQEETVPPRQGATSIEVVVFDFDCTLTSYHVYGSLAGTYTGHVPGITIPPPFFFYGERPA